MTIDKGILISLAEKYRLADKMVMAKFPNWQKQAILSDRTTGNWNSSVMVKLVQEVERIVDNMESESPKPIGIDDIETKVKKSVKKPSPKDIPDWHKFNGANEGGDTTNN